MFDCLGGAGRRAGAVTVLLLVVLWGGGGCGRNKETVSLGPGGQWIDDLRTRATEEIYDAKMAVLLMAEIDSLEVVVHDFDVATQEYYLKLVQIDREYDSSRADFEKVVSEFAATRARHRERIMDIRFRMRDMSTAEQWKAISDVDQSLFDVWQREHNF